MSWERVLSWFALVFMITVLLADGAWTFWKVMSLRTARARRRRRAYPGHWLWLAIAVLLFGAVLWATPASLLFEQRTNSDRFSDLGSAIAGGAIVAIVILLIESQQQDSRRNEDLRFQLGTNRNISGLDLRGHVLTDSYWRGKMAIDADMSGTALDRSLLTDCDFGGSFLLGVGFVGAVLANAKFDGCLLGAADFTDANLSDASFLGADYSGTHIPYPYEGDYSRGAVLTGADLSGTDLRGTILTNVVGLPNALNVGSAHYDESTIWPAGYIPPP